MKKSTKFKIVALMLGTCLTACGTTTGGGYITDQAGTYTEVVNWTDTGSLRFDENNKVQFANQEINLHTISSGKDLEGLQNLVEKFNAAHQGQINVTVTNAGQGSYYDSLTRFISTNSGVPELCMFHNEYLPTLQMSHLFQPIDRILQEAKIEFSMDDYYDGVKTNCYVGGKQFGIPVDAHSELLVYRQDLLNEYGLNVPTNFEELITAANTIQAGQRAASSDNADFTGLAISTAQFGITQYAFFTSILQNGGKLVGEDGWPHWVDETNKAAITTSINKWKELFYSDRAVSKTGLGVEEPNRLFSTGKAAFSLVYSWELTDLVALFKSLNSKENEDWGVTSLSGLFASDVNAATSQQIFGISHEFVIPKNISDWETKAAAAYVAKWLSENCAPEWTKVGHIPMNKKVYQSDEFKENTQTQLYVQHFGNPENIVNYPHVYYMTPLLEGLSKIFIAGTRSANTDISALIDQYDQEAAETIASLI